jgi:branched-chain amino acid transport system substrate-binding protein
MNAGWSRQQVAIVFMVTSMIATLALGGAVAYELGRRDAKVVTTSGASNSVVSGDQASAAEGATASDAATASGTGTATGGGASAAGAKSAASKGTSSGGATGAASAQAVTGGVIVVGGVFDETGPVDATVERDTVRAYFSMINEQGGVNGKKLQLKSCDSKFNTTDGANCANKLINDDKVFAMVGSASAGGEDNTIKAYNDAGIPFVGGLGTPNEFKFPLSYPVSANFVTYGTGMGNRAADLGFKDVGIVVVNVPFIVPVEAELEKTLKSRGVAVQNTQTVEATKANYADVVLAFQRSGVKSIVAALDPFSYQRLFQSMQGSGFKPPFLGLGLDKTSANATQQNRKQGYGEFVIGMNSLTPMKEAMDHQNDPAVRLYLDTVKKYFPNQLKALDVYTAQSWTAAQLFVDALKRAGNNPSQKSFVEALNSTKGFQGGLSPNPISYSPGPSHDPNRCFWMLENKDLIWTTVTEPKCY